MNTIHGISFIDYAATNAFLAQGKNISELLPILGIELPQWDEANMYWQNEMANDPEYKLVSVFGKVFQNPAQGKFAGMNTQMPENALAKIPTFEKFIEVQAMMSAAASYGVDAQAYLNEQGLSIMDYSQLSMHWMNFQNEQMSPANPVSNDFIQWFSNAHQYYRYKAEEFFASQNGGKLGDDITF